MKEKFLFLNVEGIGKYLKQTGGGSFTLRFYLNELPGQIPKLSTARFVLHATPAVNLFKHEAESFLNDYKRSEYLLRPMRNTHHQYHVYTIDQVIGNNRKLARKNQYTQMGLFDPDKNTSPVYQTYTRAGETGAVSNYISFSFLRQFISPGSAIVVSTTNNPDNRM